MNRPSDFFDGNEVQDVGLERISSYDDIDFTGQVDSLVDESDRTRSGNRNDEVGIPIGVVEKKANEEKIDGDRQLPDQNVSHQKIEELDAWDVGSPEGESVSVKSDLNIAFGGLSHSPSRHQSLPARIPANTGDVSLLNEPHSFTTTKDSESRIERRRTLKKEKRKRRTQRKTELGLHRSSASIRSLPRDLGRDDAENDDGTDQDSGG